MDVIRRSIIFCFFIIAVRGFSQDSPGELFSMSFEELMNLKVTTGARYETSLGETHAAIQVLSANEISAYGVENLGELLNLIKGFYITNDRNYTYVGVQGFSRPSDYNNRLLLMIDSHVLNENVYGSALMDNSFGIDLQLVDRVEVITGPGAALYGNSAMMAVVNVITVAGEKSENRVRLKTGSNNTLGGSFVSRGKSNDSSWFISGNALKSSGEDLFFNELSGQGNGGHAINLDDEKVYALYSQYNLKNFGLKFMGSHRLKGVPTAPWGAMLDERSESIDERGFVELSWQKFFSRQSFKIASSWDYYRYWGQYALPDVDYHDESIGSWGNLQLEYQLELNHKNHLIAGAEWHSSFKSNYSEVEDDVELFYKNNRFHNYSMFVQYDYEMNEKIRFLAGLRLDDYSYTNVSLSPRISAIYAPDDKLNIKLSFNKAFRAPNFYEMFYESEGANVSNHDLDHEIIYHSDLDIMNKFTKDLHGGIALFVYRLEKLIDPIVTPEDLVKFINKGSATGTGGQVYCEGKLARNFTIHTSYSYQKLNILSSQQEEGKQATNFPMNAFKAHFLYYFPKIGTLGFNSSFESGRRLVTEGKTSSFWTSGLNLKTTTVFNRVNFNLKVNNLFDNTYYHPAGLEHSIGQIIQPRRNYLLSVEIKL